MKTILIVEDDTLILTMVSTRLALEGYSVLKAQDGEEGLKLALEKMPDLILLDIIMPKMDGLTMLKLFRQHDSGKNTPVIILTTQDNAESISAAMGNKVYRYIIKKNMILDDLINNVHLILKENVAHRP